MIQEIFNKYHKQLQEQEDESYIGSGKGIELAKKNDTQKKKKCCKS